MESPTLAKLLAERDALREGRWARPPAHTAPGGLRDAGNYPSALNLQQPTDPPPASLADDRRSPQKKPDRRDRASIVLEDIDAPASSPRRSTAGGNGGGGRGGGNGIDDLVTMRKLLETEQIRGTGGYTQPPPQELDALDPHSAASGLPREAVFKDYRPESGFRVLWDRISGRFEPSQRVVLVAALGEYDSALADHPPVRSEVVRRPRLTLA